MLAKLMILALPAWPWTRGAAWMPTRRSLLRSWTMESIISPALLKELRTIAIIFVMMDVKVNANKQAIMINSMRLNEMMWYYRDLCKMVSKYWSNLPPAPACEYWYAVM
jgi:hypothetical protein